MAYKLGKHPYSAKLADEILLRMTRGETVKSILDTEGMPDRLSLMGWVDDNPKFRKQYTRARHAQAGAYADEIMQIADDGTNDFMEKKSRDGTVIGWEINGEHIRRSQLRVDTRKWVAERLAPEQYGNKLALGGAGDLPPIKSEGKTTIDVTELTLEELDFLEKVLNLDTRTKNGEEDE